MHRVNLNSAKRSVRVFFEELVVGREGVELELDGNVLCKVIPPNQLTDTERDKLVKDALAFMKRSQERNKGVPSRVIQREIEEAINEVRNRNR
jgi:hypothetical protein